VSSRTRSTPSSNASNGSSGTATPTRPWRSLIFSPATSTAWPNRPTDRHTALAAKLTELTGYIRANNAFICNYGERHRCGEAISSSIAESAVNQIISTRMVKKQQMRWTPQGAHLLLQLRTRVLNDDLADDFNRWYPGFNQLPAPVP
jgi:hypothetical protein